MTDRLEDVLGGVEDEIRRAEERLQQDVFSGASIGDVACAWDQAAGSCRSHHTKEISVVRLPT